MSKTRIILLVTVLGLASFAGTASSDKRHFPVAGVVCDAYFCADAAGVSDRLTAGYLGERQARKLIAHGRFDRTEFTFDNGIFCSVRARECRRTRYFGADGQHAGAIDRVATEWLFRR
ncbi:MULTISPECIES: YcgJ family protein [Serratia]|uniref:YcgJ family protein n=1 Tax=Serratia TaxID=613 RepID=UPI00217AA7A9|nr:MULTISPECIES: YcgJ family protein [Serratia]CAI1002471.1 Fels-1 Prophage Protein-like [Serratia quinivorans]CAI1088601.1 Fels-1 Prophage Protein-like [Serratia quinivorans]CAI2121982.1 Fels-1 Prophage Protein-like [Serratia quinivorans]CAI2488918.1 Fels-1 Prophage Protein-like [Serratia liquefaciens]